MKLTRILLGLSLALSLPAVALAQNATANSPRVQGVPDGYGDPVQVTITTADGSDPTATTGQFVRAVGNVASGAADSGAPVKIGCVYNTTLPTLTNGQRGDCQMDTRGAQYTVIANTGVAAAVASSGADALTNATAQLAVGALNSVYNGSTWDRARGDTTGAYAVLKPGTSGGLLTHRTIGAAGANVKASAGQVYGGTFTNTNAAIRYMHLYNKASAATLSTDTPIVSWALPPNVAVTIDVGAMGIQFTTGISWAYTTDDVTIPTTAGTTTEIHGTLLYK